MENYISSRCSSPKYISFMSNISTLVYYPTRTHTHTCLCIYQESSVVSKGRGANNSLDLQTYYTYYLIIIVNTCTTIDTLFKKKNDDRELGHSVSLSLQTELFRI